MKPFSNTISKYFNNFRCTREGRHLCCRQNNIFFFPDYKTYMWDIPSRILHNKFCVALSYLYIKKSSGFPLSHQKLGKVYANIFNIILTGHRLLKFNSVTGEHIRNESNKLVLPGMGVFQKRFLLLNLIHYCVWN